MHKETEGGKKILYTFRNTVLKLMLYSFGVTEFQLNMEINNLILRVAL